jgi:hypothetical protein
VLPRFDQALSALLEDLHVRRRIAKSGQSEQLEP